MHGRTHRFVVVALFAGLTTTAIPGSGSAGGGTDPLVEDSLAAVGSLVSPSNCSLRDAIDDETADDKERPYRFCDDGVPPQGGGSDGIPVPVAYHSGPRGDFAGLPRPAPLPEAAEKDAVDDLRSEADGRRITLDVNVTLPPPRAKRPAGGFPLLVFMHGCCGGNKTGWEAPTVDADNEKWHHSNSWFASRGYVVVTYTARGFRNSQDRGSTGTTQLDSRRYEINDYQYLAGLLVDHDARRRKSGKRPVFGVNPRRVGVVGGSYGGGFSWLALTDPTWRSPASRIRMRLGAVVPKYGWTDLVEALVPSGHYRDRKPSGATAIAPTSWRRARSKDPIGVMKQSIVGGLYASGNLAATDHTTFPDYLHEVFARLQAGEPYDGDPTIEATAKRFLTDRSAYFQTRFWRRVRGGLRVPTFAAATWTDPLFPTMESVRFYSKLRSLPGPYPIYMFLGDYQHFVANKDKEWGDMCGKDHHVCRTRDYRRNGRIAFAHPKRLVRMGINTRINRFLDHFLKQRGRKPRWDVAATTTICSSNATKRFPVDEPGIEHRAPSWRKLAPRIRETLWRTDKVVSATGTDRHAPESDPVFRGEQDDKCYVTEEIDPGAGVAQYRSKKLSRARTLMGIPTLDLRYTTPARNFWLAARLFDLAPNGTMTLVTRGVCRINKDVAPKRDCHRFDFFGNAWTFRKGHRAVVEVSQTYTPFFRKANSSMDVTIRRLRLEMPLTARRLRRDPRIR